MHTLMVSCSLRAAGSMRQAARRRAGMPLGRALACLEVQNSGHAAPGPAAALQLSGSSCSHLAVPQVVRYQARSLHEGKTCGRTSCNVQG